MTEADTLLPTEVHVWCTDPAHLEEPATKRAALDLLTADEHARLTRYVFERDQLIYLATRALVRTVLSRYDGVMPRDWQFVAGSHGKPALSGHTAPLSFNLSNTRGLVVCAVAREAELGIDVEELTREAPLELVADYFAPREVQALRALAPADQPFRFFEYWTLKESYIKARGLGLSLPLEQFSFSIAADRAPVVDVDPRLGDDGASWQFAQHRPTERHLVALCVRRDPRLGDLTVRWHPPVVVP